MVGDGTALADLFLQVRLGGDLALFQGLAKRLLEAEDAARAACSTGSSSTAHARASRRYAEHVRAVDWTTVARAPPA